MTDLISQYLYNNNVIGFINAIMTEAMGSLFYGAMVVIVLSTIYLRTQSIGYVVVAVLILSAGIVALIPISLYQIIGLVLVLGIGGLIALVYTRSR